MSYQSVFGGTTLYSSQPTLLSLALTADTVFEWPLQAAPGPNVIARIIEVTPAAPNLSVFMPDATQTGPGQDVMFYNAGATNFTVRDTSGNTLLVVTPGLTWALYLRDNTTANGLWRTFQYGASTANAQASALAGLGLIAQGSLLAQSQPVISFTMDYTAGASDRASAYVWTGALGTLTLSAASVLGNNWFMSLRNSGTGNLTITPSGADTINGGANVVLKPGDSCNINCDGTHFYTVGLGQNPVFAFDYTSIDLTGLSGTYVLAGSALNRISYDFVGVLAGNIEIVVPATTQQYWVTNDTTGGSFTLTIGTAAQVSPVNVVRGAAGIFYCDGSNVKPADTAAIATPIGIAQGGTGATTASGARINLGGTTVGIGVFTAANAAAGRTALLAAGLTGNTFTAEQVISINTATTAADYFSLTPTDFGVGKPALIFSKNASALKWDVDLFDGATLAGQLNFNLTLLNVVGALTASGIVTGASFAGAATAGPAAATGVGYMGAPENTQNGNYTLALTDQGEMLYHTSGTAHAYTIPPNASVAFPLGTVILIENEVGGGVVTVTRGAAVSLLWRGNSAVSADRALAANGSCAIKKVAVDTWAITGVGLS